jgi:hypothetical protein
MTKMGQHLYLGLLILSTSGCQTAPPKPITIDLARRAILGMQGGDSLDQLKQQHGPCVRYMEYTGSDPELCSVQDGSPEFEFNQDHRLVAFRTRFEHDFSVELKKDTQTIVLKRGQQLKEIMPLIARLGFEPPKDYGEESYEQNKIWLNFEKGKLYSVRANLTGE